MNRIQCEYCNQQNEASALECRMCGAPLVLSNTLDAALRWMGRFPPVDDKNVRETLYVTQAISKTTNTGLTSWRL